MKKITQRSWRIAIRPTAGQRPRKITKIISLNGDGFSVLAPYHKARSGFLCKMPVDPAKQGPYQVPWAECVSYTAEDRVKLTYHADGFAQFSSETPGRITSGRDPDTGEPKGLGLFTHALSSPIISGPSVGVTVWGIEDFDELGDREDAIVFEPSEFYYRACRPEDVCSWVLSIYTFPRNVIPPVRFHEGHSVVEVALEPLSGPLVSVVQLKTIYLPKEKVFLGLFVNCAITRFTAKSGWTLNGPGNFTRVQRGHVLMGIYPRGTIPVTGRPSLDRSPEATEQSEK